MTIRLLRTLVAIADNKTFSAAAGVVNVTHAAVSQQMQSLEADLGIALFTRTSRTPELTPAAHQIVAKARTIIAAYDNLAGPDVFEGRPGGTLRLGALRTTLTGLAPQAMAVLKSRFPELGLHIRPGLTGELLADIERGNIDAAIITKPHLLPKGVEFRQLVSERMELISAPEEPEDDPVTLLKMRPYIRFDRNAVLGALIDNWIRSRNVRVAETMELDSPEAITSMVHANLGVSIMPRLAVDPYDQIPVKRIDLGPDAPCRVLGLACHEGQIKVQAVDALYRALCNVIEKAQIDRNAGGSGR